ncbi:MAG: dihydrolipoamide acetyltransferase family protein [Phototrophicaceae bacterium]
MAQPIKLTADGLLLNWLKDVGDSVKAGEVIAEVEADKATVEIEAPVDGVLTEQNAEVGEELTEGAVIGMIGSADEADGDGAEEKAQPEPEAETDKPEQPEPEAETDKPEQPEPQPTTTSNGKSDNGQTARTPEGRIKASPLARRIAEDKGIDLGNVSGSGPGGRITKSDVEGYEPGQAPAEPAAPAAQSGTGRPAGAASGMPVGEATWGKIPEEDVEAEDISRMRRVIAEGTVRSFSNTPHFYVNREISVDALLALRKEINAGLEADGIKVSVNDMIVKAAALTLRKFPNLNSHFYGDKIVRHKRVNIGISVALPNNGLVNVVAKDADRRALSDLAVENKAMFERAREGRIKPEDVKGGTFTISNLGPYDVEWFSAIISTPEAGIIAVGAAKRKPVVKEDGSIGVATIMNATLSIDHRVSDGAEGAQFMAAFKEIIENPMRLLV